MSNVIRLAPQKTKNFDVVVSLDAARVKVPLYNVYKDDRLEYGAGTFAQCTRFLGAALGDPDGIVLVGEAMKAGYRLRALPLSQL